LAQFVGQREGVPLGVLVASRRGLAFGLIGAAVGLTQRGRGAMVTLGFAAISTITALWAAVLAHSPHLARWAFLHPWGAIHAHMISHSELYRHVTMSSYSASELLNDRGFVDALGLAPLLALALFGAVAVILARATCRRLATPQVPLLSKLQALVLFSLAVAAIMLPHLAAPPSGWDAAAAHALVCHLLLLPWMAALTAFATPGHDRWAINLRRMRRPASGSPASSPPAGSPYGIGFRCPHTGSLRQGGQRWRGGLRGPAQAAGEQLQLLPGRGTGGQALHRPRAGHGDLPRALCTVRPEDQALDLPHRRRGVPLAVSRRICCGCRVFGVRWRLH